MDLNTLQFYLSKVVWTLLTPSHLLVLLILIAVFFLRPGWGRAALLAFIGLVLLVILVLPLGNWMLVPLERCYADSMPPSKVDGIVVLGGGLSERVSAARQQPIYDAETGRLTTLVGLMRTYPQAQIIYSGGSGSIPAPDKSEARFALDYLHELGADTSRIMVEEQSRNTYENALASQPLTQRLPGNWLIVTSAYHMPRAMALFTHGQAATSVKYYAYPTDFRTTGNYDWLPLFDFSGDLVRIDRAAKEYTGIIYDRLTGRTDSLVCAANRAAPSLGTATPDKPASQTPLTAPTNP